MIPKNRFGIKINREHVEELVRLAVKHIDINGCVKTEGRFLEDGSINYDIPVNYKCTIHGKETIFRVCFKPRGRITPYPQGQNQELFNDIYYYFREYDYMGAIDHNIGGYVTEEEIKSSEFLRSVFHYGDEEYYQYNSY